MAKVTVEQKLKAMKTTSVSNREAFIAGMCFAKELIFEFGIVYDFAKKIGLVLSPNVKSQMSAFDNLMDIRIAQIQKYLLK
jgi:hypothetical protein